MVYQGLVALQGGPDLGEGELLLEEQEPSLGGQAGQGSVGRRGWEGFCEHRAPGGFELKIVTSQLLCSLPTVTFQDPRLPFYSPERK